MKKIKNKIKNLPLSYLKNNKNSIAIVFLVLLVFSIFYYFKSAFVSATVNGKPITRIQVIRDLEKRAGKQALDSLITKSIIDQKAKEAGIKVSEQDIDQEIVKIEETLKSQGQEIEQFLSMQGLTLQDIKEQINIQLKLERLLADKLNVSDSEIDSFIETNSSFFTEEQKSQPNFRESIKDQVKSQKMSEIGQTYIEELRKSADIKYLK